MKQKILKTLLLLVITTTSFAQWTNIQDLNGITNSYERFGKSIGLSNNGSVMVVGAPRDGETIDANGNTTERGSVRIYTKNNDGEWVLDQQIDGVNDDEHFGSSVSITPNADFIIVGAPYDEDPNAATDKIGISRVFEKNGNDTWSQVGEDINGENNNEYSGYSVDISDDGSTVIIGAYGYSNETGIARVYKINESNLWVKSTEFIGSDEGDQTAFSVSISSDGNTIAYGAHAHDSYKGTTRIHYYNNTTWSQIGNDIDGEEYDFSSFSISLSGDGTSILIGAYNNGTGGAARLYSFADDVWSLDTEVFGENNSYERFGYSVSLASDAQTFAVGASRTGDDLAGSAHLYNKVNDTWSQLGEDIVGEVSYDQFASVINLSPDASTFAAASFSHNGNEGLVRLYEYSDGSLSNDDITFNEITYSVQNKQIVVSSDDLSISIYDLLGRENDNNNLNGVYIVRFYDETNGNSLTKKLFIK